MKRLLSISIVAAVVITACKPKFDDPSYTGGSANFSTYVSIGNSLTAGYADGALYQSGQNNSFPSIIASQMSKVGSTSPFVQPLMADDIGGMTVLGNPLPETNKYALGYAANCQGDVSLGPGRVGTTYATEVANNIYTSQGPFNNLGIPGAKVSHLLFSGYGDIQNLQTGLANPYFVRMSSSPTATVIEDAKKLNPTFFSLWIGNNDVLGYATTGGADPNSPITPQANFSQLYSLVVSDLVSTGAKGVLANVPDVTSIPFFTTVPWNVIDLGAANASNLTLIFNGVGDFVDSAYGNNLGAQYRFKYEVGPNPLIISVPVTASNPLGFRQMTSDEFALLTTPQDSIRCAGYGAFDSRGYDPFDPNNTPQDILARIKPLMNQHVLTQDEISALATATEGYNNTIAAEASKHGLALADMNSNLANIKNNGFIFDEVSYTTTFVTGGAFSLDGVHLTPRGYAITANYFIDAINGKYGSNIPKANVNDYPGTKVP